jgi:hypothetical protein
MSDCRDVTGVATIPAGVNGTGTLTQDTEVPTILTGTGTDFYTELNKPRPYLFFPNTSPPQLLKVIDFNASGDPVLRAAADWVKVKTAPGVAIAGEAFQIISATLKRFSVLNKGGANAANGYDGVVSIVVGETIDSPVVYENGSGDIIPKDAHWVDGTGTTLEINEQK